MLLPVWIKKYLVACNIVKIIKNILRKAKRNHHIPPGRCRIPQELQYINKINETYNLWIKSMFGVISLSERLYTFGKIALQKMAKINKW